MKKLNLKEKQLTRSQMRAIDGGLKKEGEGCTNFPTCSTNADCKDINCPTCIEGNCYT